MELVGILLGLIGLAYLTIKVLNAMNWVIEDICGNITGHEMEDRGNCRICRRCGLIQKKVKK